MIRVQHVHFGHSFFSIDRDWVGAHLLSKRIPPPGVMRWWRILEAFPNLEAFGLSSLLFLSNRIIHVTVVVLTIIHYVTPKTEPLEGAHQLRTGTPVSPI